MEVILLQDVPKIGRKYEVKNVSDGFARNMLFPKRLAEPATPQKKQELEKKREHASAQIAQDDAKMKTLFDTLAGSSVTISMQANEQGHLFEALKAEAIVEAIKNQKGVTLHEEQVQTEGIIKDIGEHTLTLVHGDMIVTMVLVVAAKE